MGRINSEESCSRENKQQSMSTWWLRCGTHMLSNVVTESQLCTYYKDPVIYQISCISFSAEQPFPDSAPTVQGYSDLQMVHSTCESATWIHLSTSLLSGCSGLALHCLMALCWFPSFPHPNSLRVISWYNKKLWHLFMCRAVRSKLFRPGLEMWLSWQGLPSMCRALDQHQVPYKSDCSGAYL